MLIRIQRRIEDVCKLGDVVTFAKYQLQSARTFHRITVFDHTLGLQEMVGIEVVSLHDIQSGNQMAALLIQVLQVRSYPLADSPVAV